MNLPTLDLAGLQRKYDARRDNPFRWRTASFGLPADCMGELRQRAFRAATERWVRYMEAQGWHLQNKPEVTGPFPYHSLESGLLIVGQSEYRLRAVFATIPKPQRIELEGLNVQAIDPKGRRSSQKAGRRLSQKVSKVREVVSDPAI